ncbi:hypothetical protein C943_02311 [Mariniradius saccharolyticus AK6]|uniref:Uncharacterized protein n=1 Tax=Mariniradius saccharolyticus AK6 TaxID=1239962 RepID=M7X840_9BACT|nr:hypothetical protein C943_02311 [Mariniradius saccharolyticus AK6]
MWLQTKKGLGYEDDSDNGPFLDPKDIADYLKSGIFESVGKWSNKRIRWYLERGGEVDI